MCHNANPSLIAWTHLDREPNCTEDGLLVQVAQQSCVDCARHTISLFEDWGYIKIGSCGMIEMTREGLLRLSLALNRPELRERIQFMAAQDRLFD